MLSQLFGHEDIAIDLGTANTLIICREKVVVDSPSIVAIDRNKNKIIAFGKEARLMQGKTHENIKIVRPLKDGVIADFEASEEMIKHFILSIPIFKKYWVKPNFRMLICIPSGITQVEKKAVKEAAGNVDAKSVELIYEPMAAAIGSGIDVLKSEGSMIVDIGGGTTEIAVISLGGIVCDESIKVAGDLFNADIVNYMRTQHRLFIGDRTAESVKIKVGAALEDLDETPEPIEVLGRDLTSGKPRSVLINHKQIAISLNKSISRIEDSVMNALSNTPPEISSDIYGKGIYLTGGGALLKGLAKRLSLKTELPIHISEDPLRSVVRGTGLALARYEKHKPIFVH